MKLLILILSFNLSISLSALEADEVKILYRLSRHHIPMCFLELKVKETKEKHKDIIKRLEMFYYYCDFIDFAEECEKIAKELEGGFYA